MRATDDDRLLPFSLPNLRKKKVTAAFDGGQVSSDGGVFLLAAADKRLGLIDTLVGLIPDARDPAHPFDGGYSAWAYFRHRVQLP